MPCPRCGADNPTSSRFCGQCGAGLRPGGAATRFASPQSYTPPHLAEKILTARATTSPLTLEGERKQVTVLFADIKGSMELLADRDPEEASTLLDGVLERMIEAVHRYEGTVTQVMGDGVMALFGAPLAHEDHAVRACHAALRMQAAVTRYGDELQRAYGVPIQIRIGLNSGEVVVRSIGHDLNVSYTAVGGTVHLAARMEQMAKPASTLATGDTMRLVQPYIRGRALGRVSVRGVDAPVEVFEVVGTGPARSRMQVAAARGLTRFVGRAAELAALEAALARALGGPGQIVAVVGEAGVGKSRLFHEFTRSDRARGCLVLESGSAPYGQPSLHQPGIRLLRHYFKVHSSDGARAVREKVTGKLVTLDRGLEPAMVSILALLGALPDGDPFLALDLAERRRQSLEAVRGILDAERRVQPVILVVDDLQWADSETRRLFNAMADTLPKATLLLVNYRTGHDDRWEGKAHYARLRMEPLPPAGAEELLDALVGEDPTLRPLRRLLVERTDGNPLFLEECVRTLVDAGVLAGERGAYALHHAVEAIEVPATVQAVLAARIDRLPPDQKRLLQEASVIGEQVPVALLEATAEATEEDVTRGLEALRAADFLDPVPAAEPEYRFKHSLTHEVAYDTLLHERRRVLHGRILETLELLHPERLAEQAESLAHHAVRAEAWDKAARHLRQAGHRALARLAPREAAAYLEQALAALARLPDTREGREQAFEIRLELRNALTPLGEHARIFAQLREAKALAESLGDEHLLARALSFMSQYFGNVGASEDSLRSGERALSIAARTQDLELRVIGNFTMGAARRALGDYPAAVAFMRENVDLLTGDRLYRTFGLAGVASVLSRGHLAWSLAELGEFAEAEAVGRQSVRIADAAGEVYSICHAALGLGGTLVRQGRFEEAIAALERGTALGEQVPMLLPPLAADLGVAHARSGRVVEGLALATDAVDRATSMGRTGRLALLVAHLGEIYLAAGRRDDAREQAAAALALATEKKERGNQVYALRLLGEIAAAADPPEAAEAEARLRAALALAEELGMRPLLARCRLSLGALYRRIGEPAEAARHLEAAAALFGALKMDYWAERAEAARGA